MRKCVTFSAILLLLLLLLSILLELMQVGSGLTHNAMPQRQSINFRFKIPNNGCKILETRGSRKTDTNDYAG